MSWRVVVYGLAGWVVVACVVAPWVGRRLRARQPYVCGHCRDEGMVVVNEQPPRWTFCNFCMLGHTYEASAARRSNQQGETK